MYRRYTLSGMKKQHTGIKKTSVLPGTLRLPPPLGLLSGYIFGFQGKLNLLKSNVLNLPDAFIGQVNHFSYLGECPFRLGWVKCEPLGNNGSLDITQIRGIPV